MGVTPEGDLYCDWCEVIYESYRDADDSPEDLRRKATAHEEWVAHGGMGGEDRCPACQEAWCWGCGGLVDPDDSCLCEWW